MKSLTRQVRTLFLTAALAVGSVFVSGAAAQDTGTDTAYVPFIVNVDATVMAEFDAGGAGAAVTPVQISAKTGTETLMRIPLRKAIGVLYGAQRQANRPVIISNRGGKITLNLPAQSYKNADIALYTVNGKRVLRRTASASNAVNNISRPNLAPGAYLLSVKGTDGDAFTSRLTHSGGGVDIIVAFGDENRSSAERLTKKAEAGEWTIIVSAAGYVDSIYTIDLKTGMNDKQNITLREAAVNAVSTFIDIRDGKKYNKVRIGNQTWMAENLNYQPPTGNSWCYDNADSNCVKYGRLYDWNTAMAGAAGSNSVPSGTQGVCPGGWHLPSRGEWGALAVAAGGTGPYGDEGEVSGKKLKAKSGWNNNGAGTDDYGFSALPAGMNNDGSFSGAGGRSYWWSSEWISSSSSAYRRYILTNGLGDGSAAKIFGYSVRCVENKDVVQYKVTVSNAGTDARGGGDYIAGATVGIDAGTAPTGKLFKNWASAGVTFADANNKNTTFTMPANDVIVTAVYETTYNVTVSSAGTGASKSDSYLAGATVSIKAGTAPAGQQFKNWTSSNSSVIFADANSATTTFIMPAAAVTVTANFELAKYAVTVSSVGAGASSGGSYSAGATVSINAGTAITGYQFKEWTSSNSGVIFANANSAATTFTMPPSAVTVTANFVSAEFVDTRDGKRYRTVAIGSKSWMAENLNFQTASDSGCYSNSADNCAKYGSFLLLTSKTL